MNACLELGSIFAAFAMNTHIFVTALQEDYVSMLQCEFVYGGIH